MRYLHAADALLQLPVPEFVQKLLFFMVELMPIPFSLAPFAIEFLCPTYAGLGRAKGITFCMLTSSETRLILCVADSGPHIFVMRRLFMQYYALCD